MVKPIVPWLGGKRRLAKHILPMFPKHECYVEPFAGGAALFFLKEPSHNEVLNDINVDLINLYRVVQHHLEEFVRQFKWALVSRQAFLWAKETRPETLTDIQRAARFFYLQKLCFGARVSSQTFGVSAVQPERLNLLRLEEDLSAAHLRLARTWIERLPWQDCIARYDREHTLFYVDPPYYGTEGYGVPFELEEYAKLADLARSIKGRMIISINDVPAMREVFNGFDMEPVSVRYIVGGNATDKPRSPELVIRNW